MSATGMLLARPRCLPFYRLSSSLTAFYSCEIHSIVNGCSSNRFLVANLSSSLPHFKPSNGTCQEKSHFFGIDSNSYKTFKRTTPQRRFSSASFVPQTDGESSSDENDIHQDPESSQDHSELSVLNFYIFSEIAEPHNEVLRHQNFLKGRDIRSRIYINEQGINAQLSGPTRDLEDYGSWVKSDPRFATIHLQFSPSPEGHAFPRFKIRYKPSLVQVEGGTKELPLSDKALRAIPLTPSQWKNRINEGKSEDSQSQAGASRKLLLLDVRNGYEWDMGHFEGAERPDVKNFRETDFGLSGSENDPLREVAAGNERQSAEEVDVLMYCTGGIRCDVYSAILRQKGFKNLYTLEGGVARYLKEEGSQHWAGKLFVFDSRLAVPPSNYQGQVAEAEDTKIIAQCTSCHQSLPSVSHRNCANLDCNKLFLVCVDCAKVAAGCCSAGCSCSQRLRPFQEDPKPYARWHNYRPQEGAKRHPGMLAGRAERRQMRRKSRKAAEQAALESEMQQQRPVSLVSESSAVGNSL